MKPEQFLLVQLLLRIIAPIICIKKAAELRRSTRLWGLLGFTFPLLTVATIFLMKPKITWLESKHRVK